MIANPFNTTNNTIAVRIPNPTLGSAVFKWNETTESWNSNIFEEDDWSTIAWTVPGMTLSPGEGVVFRSTSSQTLRFFGEVLKGYQINAVSSEYSLRSSKVPLSGYIEALGAPILDGDLIYKMVNGAYDIRAFYNGRWIDQTGTETLPPSISIGESFWFQRPHDWKQHFSVWP